MVLLCYLMVTVSFIADVERFILEWESAILWNPETKIPCNISSHAPRLRIAMRQLIALFTLVSLMTGVATTSCPPILHDVPNVRNLAVGTNLYFVLEPTHNMALGTVWGTDIYTDDSNIYASAVHSGAIPMHTTGEYLLHLTTFSGRSSYRGSSRNGISSKSYGHWRGSFSIENVCGSIHRTEVRNLQACYCSHGVYSSHPEHDWINNNPTPDQACSEGLHIMTSIGTKAGTSNTHHVLDSSHTKGGAIEPIPIIVCVIENQGSVDLFCSYNSTALTKSSIGTTTIHDIDESSMDGDETYQEGTDSNNLASTLMGLTTNEDGSWKLQIQLCLGFRPTSIVAFAVSSSDTTEGIVSPSMLTFSPTTWDIPQVIEARGVDDAIADGDQSFIIVTGVLTSSDERFNGIDLSNLYVTNLDDDEAGVQCAYCSSSNSSILTTSEDGTNTTVGIHLLSEPSEAVIFDVSTNDVSEGSVTPTQITFSPLNWNVTQNVVVVGVDDLIADNAVEYLLQLDSVQSTADVSYANTRFTCAHLVNLNNEENRISVLFDSNSTSENGDSVSLSISLRSQPQNEVVLDIVSTDLTEAIIRPTQLTFGPDNWNTPQISIITGVDDDIDDGDVPFQVVISTHISTDEFLQSLEVYQTTSISLVNLDNKDQAGILCTIRTPDGTINDDPRTSESDKELDMISTQVEVALRTEPISDVLIVLESSNEAEGLIVPPSNAVFTASNWNIPKRWGIQGVDDFVADGDVQFRVQAIASSRTPTYANLSTYCGGSITNEDDDIVGILLSTDTPTNTILTSEDGRFSGSFHVSLLTVPQSNVRMHFSGYDKEGILVPQEFTFRANSNDLTRLVQVYGRDDLYVDGNQSYRIQVITESADPNYNTRVAIPDQFINVVNMDNDTLSFICDSPESGQDRFIIYEDTPVYRPFQLNCHFTFMPREKYFVNFTSTDISEATITSSLARTTNPDTSSHDYHVPPSSPSFQLNIHSVDDKIYDGDINFEVVIETSFQTMVINFTSVDKRQPRQLAVTLSDYPYLHLSRPEVAASFDLALMNKPASWISCTLSDWSSTVPGPSLSFSPDSVTWVPNAWTVSHRIMVEVSTTDTSELWGNALFHYISISCPTLQDRIDHVEVLVTDPDVVDQDYIVSGSMLLSPRTTNSHFPLTTSSSSFASFFLQGRLPRSRKIRRSTYYDKDDSHRDEYVFLQSSNSNVGTIDQICSTSTTMCAPWLHASSSSMWFARKTRLWITIQGAQNMVNDERYSIDIYQFVSSSFPIRVPILALTDSPNGHNEEGDNDDGGSENNDTSGSSNQDDNGDVNDGSGSTAGADIVPKIIFHPSGGLLTDESGGTDVFTAMLSLAPTSDVAVTFLSSLPSEGFISPQTIIFSPQDWDVPQVLTITGVSDNIVDGNMNYRIVSSSVISSDHRFDGLITSDVTVTNIDKDIVNPDVNPDHDDSPSNSTTNIEDNTSPVSDTTLPTQTSSSSGNNNNHNNESNHRDYLIWLITGVASISVVTGVIVALLCRNYCCCKDSRTYTQVVKRMTQNQTRSQDPGACSISSPSCSSDEETPMTFSSSEAKLANSGTMNDRFSPYHDEQAELIDIASNDFIDLDMESLRVFTAP